MNMKYTSTKTGVNPSDNYIKMIIFKNLTLYIRVDQPSPVIV